MSKPTRNKKPRRQMAVTATPLLRAAAIMCLAIVVFATPRHILAADPCLDTPCAHENAALTMEEAMDMAESSSPSVASARRGLEIAGLQLRAAEAGKRPSVTVHASPLQIQAGLGDAISSALEEEKSLSFLSQAGGEVRIPFGSGNLSLSANLSLPLSGSTPPEKPGWSAHANLSLPLLGAGSRAPESAGSARSQVGRHEFQLEQAIRQARGQAQAAYFNTLAAQDRVAAADRGLVRARDHSAFVEGQRRLGNASELDVLEARASVARAQAAAESARHSLAVASMNLNLAIGRELEAPVLLAPAKEYIDWPEGMDLDACVEGALNARPEILLAEQDLTDAEAALAQAIAAKRPGVFLQGQASSGGSWHLGLEVSALLTRDYAAEIAIESAKDRVSQARSNIAETRNSIILEVVEAFYNLREAEASIELARSAVAIAAATLEVKEEQCRIGSVSYAEVSEAIEAVRKAESDLASQRAGCFMAKSRLAASIGWENI